MKAHGMNITKENATEKYNDFDFLYDELMRGTAFGYANIGLRYPTFNTVLCKGRTIQTQNLFVWRHYGESANKATKKDLRFILEKIFGMTATDFLRRYYPECYFVAQLPRREKFTLFKRVKAHLLKTGQYCYENLVNAMGSKLHDLDFGYDFM